jgi:tRNA threonylcarbamoyladenosine biosynthesis protein TsaB
MIILTIRTDKPEAEIGLYDGTEQLAYETWQAHRQLAETIHQRITALLAAQSVSLKSLKGIVVFEGPGSFTGLRIGMTVANALAMGLEIPVVAARDPKWIEQGIRRALDGENDHPALPEYGADVHITAQKR